MTVSRMVGMRGYGPACGPLRAMRDASLRVSLAHLAGEPAVGKVKDRRPARFVKIRFDGVESSGGFWTVSYTMTSQADEDAVRLSYIYLFGREPENDLVVAEALTKSRTIQQIRADVLNSGEYKSKFTKELQAKMIDKYLACISERITDKYHSRWPADSEILILQTSDSTRYIKLLNASSAINMEYAFKNGIGYSSYIGIKRGIYPHHATYNRVHLLSELVEQNYTGWILYIDADAMVSQPEFDIKSHFSDLRNARKCMSLHLVHQASDPRYKWWNINAGCFAIDLASERARFVVKAWAGIYNDLFSMEDYKKAHGWTGVVIDDQSALWEILKKFDMFNHVELTDIQGENGYIKQFLRKSGASTSTDNELEQRRAAMESYGRLIYPLSPTQEAASLKFVSG